MPPAGMCLPERGADGEPAAEGGGAVGHAFQTCATGCHRRVRGLFVSFSNSSPAMVKYSSETFRMVSATLPPSRIGTFEFGSVGATRTRVPGAEWRRELVVSEWIAGIEIPDSRLAAEATALVREAEPPLLFDHSRRVYLFGMLQ